MSNTRTSELVAKRWAKALIDLTSEHNEVSKEEVLANLKEISENITQSEELQNVINDPSISVDEKQAVIYKLFDNRVLPLVKNFLYVLVLRKRLDIISEISDEYQKELEKLNNIVRVNVTSAIEIDEDKKDYIKSRISAKLQKDVIADWKVNSDIIAGLVFNMNDTVVDNSIKHKLDEFSKNIIRG